MKGYIAPDILVRLFINRQDARATAELLQDESVDLILSDFALFEALSSCERDEIDTILLSRIIEGCEWFESGIPKEQFVITSERKAHLRRIAMGPEGGIVQ